MQVLLDRIISFINTTEDPSVERLLIPDMALTAAEYFSVEKKEKVTGTPDGHDKLCRRLGYRLQPYGPDPL